MEVNNNCNEILIPQILHQTGQLAWLTVRVQSSVTLILAVNNQEVWQIP